MNAPRLIRNLNRLRANRLLGSLAALAALSTPLAADVTLLSQNFSTDPVNYTLPGTSSPFRFYDGPRYWAKSDMPGLTVNASITGSDGPYLGAQNLNDGGFTFTDTSPAQIDFTLPVTGYSNLKLSIALAGLPGAEDINFIRAKTDNDGDGTYETTLFDFKGTNNTAYTDTVLGALSAAFKTFSDIVLPTSTAPDGMLRLRLESFNDTDGFGEATGIDSIAITGTLVNYPTIVVTAPANGQKFPPGTAIDATATVGGGGTPPYTVRVFTNNPAMGTTYVQVGPDLTGAGPAFTVPLGIPDAGNYNIYATVTDSASQPNTSPTNSFAVVNARYWDTSPSAGLQAGDGTWDTENMWSTDTLGSNPLVAWLEGSETFFQTLGVNNVTLNGTVQAGLLSLSGSGTVLNLSGGTLQLAAAGAAVSAGTTLQIGLGGSTGSLDTGLISNAGTLLFNRTGELSYAGNISGTGVLRNIGGGTLTLTGTLGTAGTPIGQVVLKQGATVIDSSGQLYPNTSLYIGQAGGDNATLTLKGNAKLNTSTAATGDSRIRIGDGGGVGILNVQDSAVVDTGFDRYIIISSTGTFNVSGSGAVGAHRVYLAGGTVNVSDSALLTSRVVPIGGSGDHGDWRSYGNVVINQSGGTLGDFGWSQFGASTFNISGGLFLPNGGSGPGIGSGGSPTFNLTGGETRWNNGNIQGNEAAAVFNLGGTSVMAMNRITPGAGTITFNFNGGTLKALASIVDFLPAGIVSSVKSGGARVDTDGKDVTMASALTHDGGGPATDGGLTKKGAGTLTLAGTNTYTGATTVEAGILAVNGTSISNTGKLVIGGGKVQATGTETVDTLFFGGTPQVVGTWGATGSGAEHIDDSRFTGIAGMVLVLTKGTGNDYSIWAGNYPAADLSNPDADYDHDGMTNQQEYAFGLDPTTGTSVNPIIGPIDKTSGMFKYTRRATPATTGLTYTVWTSTNLTVWTKDDDASTGQTVESTSGEVETVVVTLTGAPLTFPTLFMRVIAE